MKKFLIIVSFFIAINRVSALSASSYIVMDMNNNNIVMGNNINSQFLVASTSKIMTAIIAIEQGNLNDVVKADESILRGVGSSIYIEIGEKLTLEDLLYGMLLRSGNDAAIMIANCISGSEEKFTELMNAYASKIGMKNTIFYNASGLENKDNNGNTSTAYDMALLTSYAYKNKTFRKIFKTKYYETKSDKKTYTWKNKNKLLRYDYITGGKTGYTKKAKRTLVSTGCINDTNIVIVTLKDYNDWQDHLNIYSNLKKNYVSYEVLNKNKFYVENSIFLEDTLYIKKSYSLFINRNNLKNIKVSYNLYELDKYRNNQKVGVVEIYNKNNLIYKENIYISKVKQSIIAKIKKHLL